MEETIKQSKLSIMQPYIFPYIGYFQLIQSTDKIVFCDDVTFIKNGWISRNKILSNYGSQFFSVPLNKKSSNKLIKDTTINLDFYPLWKKKFYNTIYHNYSRAPYFDDSFKLIERVFDADFEKISDLAIHSIISVYEYLGMNFQYEISSEKCLGCAGIDKVDRIVNVCNLFGYKKFNNPIGGIFLYDKNILKSRGIELAFVKPKHFTYQQFNDEFVPWLSIIDLLMFLDKNEIVKQFSTYELV